MTYLVRRISENDEDLLFSFKEKVLQDNDNNLNRELWRWKYLMHPYAKEPPFFVVESKGEIVGSQGYWPMQLSTKNGLMTYAHLMDFNILDPYRGLPVVMLLKKTISNADISFSSNLSKDARVFFKSARWVDLSAQLKCFYHYIKEPNNLPLKKQLKECYRTMSMMSARINCSSKIRGNVEVRVSDSCPSNINEIFGVEAENSNLHIIKDYRYFFWRYDLCPIASYKYVSTYTVGKIRSFVVFTIAETSKYKKCMIMDMACNANSEIFLKKALIELIIYCERNNVDYIETISSTLNQSIMIDVCFKEIQSDLGLIFKPIRGKGDTKQFSGSAFSFMAGDTDVYS